MKAKAFYWAELHVSISLPRLARIHTVNFSNVASEYSNQISSRADALYLQKVDKFDRKSLPLSQYLRDVKPTDFLNLHTWKRAADHAIFEEVITDPLNAFSSDETADRVRVIERLFADHNWSKINTVYASGQGVVSIALIKDDIGNWNLKSFDSDPTEVVAAYKQLTQAGIKAATDLVAASATGGSTEVAQALQTASRMASGRIGGGSAPSGLNVKSIRSRAEQRLADLQKEAKKEQDEIQKKIDTANTDAVTASTKVENLETPAGTAENAIQIPPSTPPTNDTKADSKQALETLIKARVESKQVNESNTSDEAKTTAKSALEDAEKANAHYGKVQSSISRVERLDAEEKRELAAEEDKEKRKEITRKKNEDKEKETKKAQALAAAALARANVAKAKAEKASIEAKKTTFEKKKKAHYKATIAQARSILKDYAAVIDALQEASVPNKSAIK